MPPCCPLAHAGGGGGGYRGPPPPLILAPIIYQLVRRSADPKMVAYVKDLLAKQGPQAVAANAHKIVQYALSKVPANILYWFTAKVLNLPPDAAMQTTEFLKSRTEIEYCDDVGARPALMSRGDMSLPYASSSEIERRLERLEMNYRLLQERHYESMKTLTYKPENMYLPRELPLPDSEELRAETEAWVEVESNMRLVNVPNVEDSPTASTASLSESNFGEGDVGGSSALLQEVGLRVGRVFLEWAGETIKQSLVTAAAAKMSANQPLAGAGIDLAGRLVDAMIV